MTAGVWVLAGVLVIAVATIEAHRLAVEREQTKRLSRLEKHLQEMESAAQPRAWSAGGEVVADDSALDEPMEGRP